MNSKRPASAPFLTLTLAPALVLLAAASFGVAAQPAAPTAPSAASAPAKSAKADKVVKDTKAAKAAKPASPIYGVTIPDGYRQWELVGVATEDAPLDELRAVVGNKIAIDAYKLGKLPFPDGAMLVKLAWKRQRSSEFPAATVPAQATTVQVMVKDAKRYAASGGWGYGRFINGQPVDVAQHQTCFACHESLVKARDDVFTRLAP